MVMSVPSPVFRAMPWNGRLDRMEHINEVHPAVRFKPTSPFWVSASSVWCHKPAWSGTASFTFE